MYTDVFREYMDLNKYEICRNKSALLTSFLRDLITKANNEESLLSLQVTENVSKVAYT